MQNVTSMNHKAYTLFRTCLSAFLIIIFFSDPSSTYAQSQCGGFRTQTQGGWGTEPRGNNPGTYLHRNFKNAFPIGLTVGCNNKLTLTSAQAVTDFLPSGSTPMSLPKGTLINPANRYRNVFAGQVVALKLSVTFDNFDASFSSSTVALKNLVIKQGKLTNKTVGEVLGYAEQALGGCTTPYSISELNDVVSKINENFVDGKQDLGFLVCPLPPVDPCKKDTVPPTFVTTVSPTVTVSGGNCLTVNWSEPVVIDNVSSKVLITGNYPPGHCFAEGTYDLILTAKDSCGNSSTQKVTLRLYYDYFNQPLKRVSEKLELSANAAPQSIKVNWVSDLSDKTEYFIVQKMTEQGKFVDIGTVNSTKLAGLGQYIYNDEKPEIGENIYRIQTILNDGTIRLSGMQKVRYDNADIVKTFPNPASDILNVDLTAYKDKNVTLVLYNQLGNAVRRVSVMNDAPSTSSISVEGLPIGQYILSISAEGKRTVTRLIVVSQ